MTLDWETIVEISQDFLTAIPPPWNLWWNDLPLEFIPYLIESLLLGKTENASHPEDGIQMHPSSRPHLVSFTESGRKLGRYRSYSC